MAIDYRAVEAAHTEPDDEARARIGAFLQRFSLAHFDLACHAAAPMLLTPDLLYQLWAQFTPPDTPWTAVSDVLLSGLCTDVGHEAYRMGPTTRRLLLQELERKHATQRLKDLTEFLWVYAEQEAKAGTRAAEARAQAEMVNALALSNAEEAEAEFLALAGERVGQGQSLSTVSLNLLNLLHQLPGGIAGRRREVVEQLSLEMREVMGLVEMQGAEAGDETGITIRVWNFDVVLKVVRDTRSNIESVEVITTSEVTGLTDQGFSMQRKKQPPAKTEVLVTVPFLRDYLVQHFSWEEIKLFPSEMNDLAPTLGKKLVERLDADNIAGSSKTSYAQGLVQYLERRTLLDLLIALLSSKQPFIDDSFPISTMEQVEALYEVGKNTVSLDQVATLTKMLMLNTIQAGDQRTLGQLLRQMFFTSAGISSLAESLRPKRIGTQGRLRIRIQTDDHFLLSLPWELICFTQEDQELTELAQPFLGLNPKVSIVRYSPSHEAQENLSALNLGVFYIAAFFANPHGMPPLNLKQEKQNLREAVQSATQFKYLSFDDDWSQKDLTESLRSMDANIFHFSGHGQFLEQKTGIDSGSIYLRNEPTLAQPLESDALASMLREVDVRLAVINADYSARRSSRGPDQTPVGELSTFIPAVIGMQFSLQDERALTFTRAFYTSLALGWPVDIAVTQARLAVSDRAEHAPYDWAAPVLYLSVQQDVVFPPIAATVEKTRMMTLEEEREAFFTTMQRMLIEKFSVAEMRMLAEKLGISLEETETSFSRVDWPNEKVRKLLTESYGVDQLGFTTLCADIPEIAPVRFQLADGMDMEERIQKLIDFCDRDEVWERLLKALDKKFPRRFKRALSE